MGNEEVGKPESTESLISKERYRDGGKEANRHEKNGDWVGEDGKEKLERHAAMKQFDNQHSLSEDALVCPQNHETSGAASDNPNPFENNRFALIDPSKNQITETADEVSSAVSAELSSKAKPEDDPHDKRRVGWSIDSKLAEVEDEQSEFINENERPGKSMYPKQKLRAASELHSKKDDFSMSDLTIPGTAGESFALLEGSDVIASSQVKYDTGTETNYLVKKGDSLSTISRELLGENVTDVEVRDCVHELTKHNKLINQDLIYPGQSLKIPGHLNQISTGQSRVRPSNSEVDSSAKSSDLSISSGSTREITITVKENDTLWNLCKLHLGGNPAGVDIKKHVEFIAGHNNISNPDKIRVGDRIHFCSNVPTEPVITSKPEDLGQVSVKSIEVEEEDDEFDDYIEPPEPPPRYSQLLKVAKDHGIDSSDFKENLETIETRIDEGKSNATEIEDTYKHVERLLETKSSAGVSDEQRVILARQIIAQTAYPTRIDQGCNNTCNVNTVECRLYTRTPSHAARMVVDLALTGKYTAADGTHVDMTRTFNGPDGKPVRMSVEPKDVRYCLKVPVDDGKRSYASELFQVCAVNVHYEIAGDGSCYVQRKYDELNPLNEGEFLYKSDGQILKSPDLTTGNLVEIHNAITGLNETGFVIEIDNPWPEAGVTMVKSQADLDNLLHKANLTNQFPFIIAVHTANDPFWTDSGAGSAGGAGGDTGGWHVVTITEYHPGPTPTVSLDNQWGLEADKTSFCFLPSTKELYRAMMAPEDALQELTKEVEQLKLVGKSNSALEFDILRLSRLIDIEKQINSAKDKGLSSPTNFDSADFDEKVKALVNRHRERWAKEMESKQTDPEEQIAGFSKVTTLVNLMSHDNRIEFAHELERGSIISREEYLTYLEDYGNYSMKRNPDTGDFLRNETVKNFRRLMAELSLKEKDKMMDALLVRGLS